MAVHDQGLPHFDEALEEEKYFEDGRPLQHGNEQIDGINGGREIS